MGQHKEPYPMSEIIEQSKGFKGIYTEAGRDGSQSLSGVHPFAFGVCSCFEGSQFEQIDKAAGHEWFYRSLES